MMYPFLPLLAQPYKLLCLPLRLNSSKYIISAWFSVHTCWIYADSTTFLIWSFFWLTLLVVASLFVTQISSSLIILLTVDTDRDCDLHALLIAALTSDTVYCLFFSPRIKSLAAWTSLGVYFFLLCLVFSSALLFRFTVFLKILST